VLLKSLLQEKKLTFQDIIVVFVIFVDAALPRGNANGSAAKGC
jgi:hypothetical protein